MRLRYEFLIHQQIFDSIIFAYVRRKRWKLHAKHRDMLEALYYLFSNDAFLRLQLQLNYKIIELCYLVNTEKSAARTSAAGKCLFSVDSISFWVSISGKPLLFVASLSGVSHISYEYFNRTKFALVYAFVQKSGTKNERIDDILLFDSLSTIGTIGPYCNANDANHRK